MTPPTRWLQDPSAPSELRALLSVANPPEPLPPAIRQQTEQRLSLWLSLGTAGVSLWSLQALASKLPTASAQLGNWLAPLAGYKLTLVTLLALGGAGTVAAVRSHSESVANSARQIASAKQVAVEKSRLEAPSVGNSAEQAPVENPAALALTATTSRAVAPGAQLSNKPAADSHNLLAEAGDLRRIRALSDPTLQLRELKQHRARFPKGQLKTERQLLQSQLLLQLGRTQESCAVLSDLLRGQAPNAYTSVAEQRLAKCNAAAQPSAVKAVSPERTGH